MKKFNKLLILVCIEIILVFLMLGLSEKSQILVTIFFPPIFAVTLYFLVFITLELETKSKKTNIIFALLLASIALFSTSIGFHFAANDLDNLIAKYPELSFFTQGLTSRIYYLDELFSHWIMFAGIIGILIAAALWIYFKTRKKLVNKEFDKQKETRLMDLFIMAFFGTLIGAILALGSIEANIIKYGIAVVILIIPLIIYKYRDYTFKTSSRDTMIFLITLFSAYFAVAVAYYLITKTNFIVNIPFWR